ncbi:PIG-L family deacetylase [Actinokineospora cianjurensis]|uniref:GlcNAc-PI de-N-acetylase n=1 Tax=Actinokineospora cianjurensis TaxID=585224 RepID=A0A421BDD8_9PSEU|nr:PIG-L family deacetylase [Actinokineospora cianjurensis]RLK62353.1 GlcNAc-PI de-N-acetylase [Actinokineospora cianjurensis]
MLRKGIALVGATIALVAPAPAAKAAGPTPVVVSVVAHQDDDILFIDPDLRNTIRAGRAVTNIFVTAGEAWLAPGDPGDLPDASGCRDHELVREAYAYCRQRGAMAAWANMAGVADTWSADRVTIPTTAGNVRVERRTLVPRPTVQLLFLNLPENADSNPDVAGPDGASLVHLWQNDRTAMTLVPWGNTNQRYTYDHARLTQVLSGLFTRLRATVIRTQDPHPDPRYQGDHDDHVMTARFATEAAEIYNATQPSAQLYHYRDYNISDAPTNLPGPLRADKGATFSAYAAWDGFADPTPTGAYLSWTQRLYHRDSTGTTWVGQNNDGRLQAFAVEGGKLVTWYQRASGAINRGEVLPTPWPLVPGVTVGRNADRRLQVFARRADTNEIVSTWQTAVDAGFSTTWVSLGNPNAGSDDAFQVGAPVVATGFDGLLRVAVKNGGGGVSVNTQQAPSSGFGTAWDDIQGAGAQDPVAVQVDREGGVNVFAYAIEDGVGHIRHWHAPYDAGTHTTGAFTQEPYLAGYEPAGPPVAVHNKDGRLDVFYRLATTATDDFAGLVGHTWQHPDNTWSAVGEQIGGHGGVGEVAAADAPGGWSDSTPIADSRILVFSTNGTGGLSTTRQSDPDGGYPGAWTDLGAVHVGQPAAGVDRQGCVFSFALTDSGSLTVRNQTTCSGGQPLSRVREIAGP